MSTTKTRPVPAYAGKAQHAAVRAAIARLFPDLPAKAHMNRPTVAVDGSARMVVDRVRDGQTHRTAIAVAEVSVRRPTFPARTKERSEQITAEVDALRVAVRDALRAAGWTVTERRNAYTSDVLYVHGPGVDAWLDARDAERAVEADEEVRRYADRVATAKAVEDAIARLGVGSPSTSQWTGRSSVTLTALEATALADELDRLRAAAGSVTS